MRIEDTEDEGKRVWLGSDELEQLLALVEDPRRRLAMLLMSRSGLRRSEAVQIKNSDIVDTETGPIVRVWDEYAKNDRHREPPAPRQLVDVADTYSYSLDDDEPLVDVDTSTIYRWVQDAAQAMKDRTDDRGWDYVTPHDLRRTWAVQLLEDGVFPTVVMLWGGWQDWETFRDHYLTEFSPDGLRLQRAMVPYLEEAEDLDELAEKIPALAQPQLA